jgi:hypothetical protein
VRPENERELLADWFSRVQYEPVLDWHETPEGYDVDVEEDDDE